MRACETRRSMRMPSRRPANAASVRGETSNVRWTPSASVVRGGAALSVTHVTEVPIKFVGTGEKPEALEDFHPERMASRILGMGDILTLVERAEASMDEKGAKKLEEKLRKNQFTLEDFLVQMQQLKKL